MAGHLGAALFLGLAQVQRAVARSAELQHPKLVVCASEEHRRRGRRRRRRGRVAVEIDLLAAVGSHAPELVVGALEIDPAVARDERRRRGGIIAGLRLLRAVVEDLP